MTVSTTSINTKESLTKSPFVNSYKKLVHTNYDYSGLCMIYFCLLA